MPFLDEAEAEVVHDNVATKMINYVTPDPELEDENRVSNSECVAEEEPAAKKPKTALGNS